MIPFIEDDYNELISKAQFTLSTIKTKRTALDKRLYICQMILKQDQISHKRYTHISRKSEFKKNILKKYGTPFQFVDLNNGESNGISLTRSNILEITSHDRDSINTLNGVTGLIEETFIRSDATRWGNEDINSVFHNPDLPYIIEVKSREPIVHPEYGQGVLSSFRIAFDIPSLASYLSVAPFLSNGLSIRDIQIKPQGKDAITVLDGDQLLLEESEFYFEPDILQEITFSLFVSEVTIEPPGDYVYMYGIKNIKVFHKYIPYQGEWVSKPIKVHANTKDIGIVCDFEDQNSSLQAYVSLNGESWEPVHPINQEVFRDVLRFEPYGTDGKWRSKLRFEPRGEVDISFEHDEALSIDGYIVSDLDQSNQVVTYIPKSKHHYLHQDESIKWEEEEFALHRDILNLQLSRVPYVDPSRISNTEYNWDPSHLKRNSYVPMFVQLSIDDHIWLQPLYQDDPDSLMNQTIYKTRQKWNTEGYSYAVKGNGLYFNRPLPSGTKVIVKYPVLLDEVYVKLVITRDPKNNYMPPKIHSLGIVPIELGVEINELPERA